MTKEQRIKIIRALKALQRANHEFFDVLKEDYCPHNVGLQSGRENECGMNDTKSAFVIGYCSECWEMAMEDKQ